MFIGIDFGTSYTEFSVYYKNGNQYSMSSPLFGPSGIETLMRFDDLNGWVYGEECNPARYPNETITNVKKEFRKKGNINEVVESSNIRITYKDLLSNFLSYVMMEGLRLFREQCPNLINEPVERIVITVPCGFGVNGMTSVQYNQELKKAYEQALRNGFIYANYIDGQNVDIIIREEPVAAAMAYYYYNKNIENLENTNLNIVVLDIGGGTSDITLLKSTHFSDFEVLDKDGDLELGGTNWDEKLLDLVIKKINQKGLNYDEKNRKLDLIMIRQSKENFSRRESQRIRTCAGYVVDVSKEEFISFSNSLEERVKKLVSNFVGKNGGINNIDRVVLVGGTCKMPRIKELIMEMYSDFPEKYIKCFPTSYAIADGAAYMASLNNLSDIASHTYGFNYSLIDEKTKKQKKIIRNLIFKGQEFVNGKIGGKDDYTYSPIDNAQTYFRIMVYESDFNIEKNEVCYADNMSRVNPNGIELTIDVPKDYSGRAKEYKVQVELILTADGLLKLEVYHEGDSIGCDQKNIG